MTGKRINYGGSGSFYAGNAGGGGGTGDPSNPPGENAEPGDPTAEPSAPPEPTDDDPPRVAAEVKNAANLQAVQAAALRLTERVAALTQKIMALPNDARVALQGPFFLTGAEIKALWNRVNFLVTDRTDFGTDRGGAVIGDLSQMSFKTVQDWDSNVTNGLDFIMLHEMMHISDQAKSYDEASWNAHSNDINTRMTPYDGDNPYFRSNESFVNHAAFNLTLAFGDGSHIDPDQPADKHPREWTPPYGL